MEAVRTAAHMQGATVNDLILTAVATALHRLLLARGEYVEEFVISVLFLHAATRQSPIWGTGAASSR